MNGDNIFELIIVGGGPGGAAAALRAREFGLNVLLIDKKVFPRDKVCGDALSGKTVEVLKKLKLLDKVAEIGGFQANAVIFGAPSGKEIRIEFIHSDPTQKSYGFVLKRYIYDDFLLGEVKKNGADVREGYSFDSLILDDITGQVSGIVANDEKGESKQFFAPLVIGSDGFGSRVAKQIGNIEKSLKHSMAATRSYYRGVSGLGDAIELYFLDELKSGYFWIFPMKDGLANVGLGIRKDDLKSNEKNLIELQERVINSTRFKNRFTEAEIEGKISGWILPSGNIWRKLYSHGVMLVGDAAGLIDPFTGEGIGNAMTSGYISAEVAYRASLANRFDNIYLREYEILLKKRLASELKTSTALQNLSRHKWLLNMVIGKAATSKEIKEFISGMLANENAKEELKSPFFYLKLLFK